MGKHQNFFKKVIYMDGREVRHGYLGRVYGKQVIVWSRKPLALARAQECFRKLRATNQQLSGVKDDGNIAQVCVDAR